MKKLSLIFASVLLASITVINANAADTNTASHNVGITVNDLALINIKKTGSGGVDITLNPAAPTEAGSAISFTNAKNDDLWLNYSSIVASSDATRTITAKLDKNLPDGILLKLTATTPDDKGKGKGTLGESVAQKATLTSGETTVINGIGSCYTGNGANAGSNLSYVVEVDPDKYATIFSKAYTVTVTYTISE